MDQALIDNAFKVLEKEGNKVARDGEFPPGKNADAKHDVASFNAGMRYALQKVKTSLKQISEGKYVLVEFPVQGQHKVSATPAKAPAKKGTTAKKATKPAAKATKAPAKRAPAKKAVAKKSAPVKRITKKAA
jgi:hypothetical protein